MTAYSIAYGRTEEHAAELLAGLSAMPQGFIAKVCAICAGRGEYEQTYTAGCGGGYFRSTGGCDYCEGTGLRQGGKAAPASVREQVLQAGRRAAPAAASLTFSYRNWRGEVSVRKVRPFGIRFGATEWHPEAQWLLHAFDLDKQADRAFAIKDIGAPAALPSQEDVARMALVEAVLLQVVYQSFDSGGESARSTRSRALEMVLSRAIKRAGIDAFCAEKARMELNPLEYMSDAGAIFAMMGKAGDGWQDIASAQPFTDTFIDQLTDGEADTVAFCSPNPDFNGLPNECVMINASWTGWEDRYFRADTRKDCLDAAVKAMREAALPAPPASGGAA